MSREVATALSVGCAHNPIAKTQKREGAKRNALNFFAPSRLCVFASLRLRDIDTSRPRAADERFAPLSSFPDFPHRPFVSWIASGAERRARTNADRASIGDH